MIRSLLAVVLLLCSSCSRLPKSEHIDNQFVSLIALGSCLDQNRDQSVLRQIAAEKPDLFLMLGDNIYINSTETAKIRAEYAKLSVQPWFQRLQQNSTLLSVWDDNDYGLPDGGADHPNKEGSKIAFLEAFRVSPQDVRRSREGIYTSYMFGTAERSLQVLLLDTRTFRSPLMRRHAGKIEPYLPTSDETATILGPRQWEWLEQQLKVPAAIRIIASSIQVLPDEHGWEKWGNFPHERERLLGLLQKVPGVIIVSGDRHHAEISEWRKGPGYPLFEFTSSSLNMDRPGHREFNRYRIGPQIAVANYGLIRILWHARSPRVELEVRKADGKLAVSHRISSGSSN